MKTLAKVILGCVVAAGLAACDTEDGTRASNGDRPLAKVQGTIQGPVGVHYASPNVGLVWVNWGDGSEMVPEFLEQVTAIDASAMPVSFGLSVFQAPPAAAYNAILDWDGETELGRLAMALVVALDDVDGNGAFVMNETGIDAPDRLFGVSWNDALIHLPAALPSDLAAGMFSNPEAATIGFHVARMDPCTGQFTIVDDGTFVIETFPASSTFPEDGGDEVPECGDPGTGPCTDTDPESPACAQCLEDAFTECLTITCGPAMDALTVCAEAAGCDPADEDGTCVEANCSAEVSAFESCLYTCNGWTACYEGPVEG